MVAHNASTAKCLHAHGTSSALQLPRAALIGPTKNANPAYSDVQQSTTSKPRRRCWHHCEASFRRCKITTNDDATTASAAASALRSMPVVRDPSLTSQVRGPWSWHELDELAVYWQHGVCHAAPIMMPARWPITRVLVCESGCVKSRV